MGLNRKDSGRPGRVVAGLDGHAVTLNGPRHEGRAVVREIPPGTESWGRYGLRLLSILTAIVFLNRLKTVADAHHFWFGWSALMMVLFWLERRRPLVRRAG